MPEPIDHRAEAEHFLDVAKGLGDDAQVIAVALIGIGHALLAEPAEPTERILERRMEALAQLFVSGGSMPTAAAVRAALRGEPASPPPLSQHETIDVPNFLVSHEDGKQALYDHLRSQGLHPPLSPSEG